MAPDRKGIDLYRAASRAERDSAEGFIKTTDSPAAAGKKKPRKKHASGRSDTGSRVSPGSKAARLLLLLGKDEAARVMAQLDPEEAEDVARQIAETPRVDTVEAREILDEFGDSFPDMEARRARGGVEAAREILSAAFGDDQAEKIINSAIPDSVPKPFSFLEDLTFNQLANLLRKENPLTMSLVLAYMEPSQASRLLESMPDEDRGAVILRMARTEKVSKEVIETVETTLQEKLRLIGKDDSEEMDGRSALADILRFMDLGDERRLLDELGDADALLAEQVKEKLFTMDSVLHLRDRDLQNILMDMDERIIALILKGQSPEIRDRITSSLSSRRRILVADEGDLMGPRPRSEVDEAVQDFLERIRDGEEKGTYIILREESDLI